VEEEAELRRRPTGEGLLPPPLDGANCVLRCVSIPPLLGKAAIIVSALECVRFLLLLRDDALGVLSLSHSYSLEGGNVPGTPAPATGRRTLLTSCSPDRRHEGGGLLVAVSAAPLPDLPIAQQRAGPSTGIGTAWTAVAIFPRG
jgi:hypothetical protein